MNCWDLRICKDLTERDHLSHHAASLHFFLLYWWVDCQENQSWACFRILTSLSFASLSNLSLGSFSCPLRKSFEFLSRRLANWCFHHCLCHLFDAIVKLNSLKLLCFAQLLALTICCNIFQEILIQVWELSYSSIASTLMRLKKYFIQDINHSKEISPYWHQQLDLEIKLPLVLSLFLLFPLVLRKIKDSLKLKVWSIFPFSYLQCLFASEECYQPYSSESQHHSWVSK